MRRFAIVASQAPASGSFSLNDLPGSGRMDLICRNIGSALLLSHSIRNGTEAIVHLLGGPGKPRRVRFRADDIIGLRPDERSIAGRMKNVIEQPLPPIGIWKEVSPGISQSGGGLRSTLTEWSADGVVIYQLDKDGPSLDYMHEIPPNVGFLVGDHRRLEVPSGDFDISLLSVGENWLLGSACISIVHHWLDSHLGNPSSLL